MESTLTAKQTELAEAISARNCKASWWLKGATPRLYVERKHDKVFLTFDDAANVFGAKVHQAEPTRLALHVGEIAFYEALRIGNPEALPEFVAECDRTERWDGAPEAQEARR